MQSQNGTGPTLEPKDDLASRRARLFEGIGKVIPASLAGALHQGGILSDTQYTHVTHWCESNRFHEWGKRPRTLVILHIIGCPEAIDGFVNEGLSDIALPYSEENLPRVIRGSKRAHFIAHQNKVLSEQAIDLERPGGAHCNIDGNADVHFHLHRDLGSGGFGTVDHVFSRLSLQSFARKRIPRGRSFKKDQVAIQMFENELTTFKALSHRHLVRLIGSYTDRKFVGLIMTPVADMDLHTYLLASRHEIPDQIIRLRRFFGCLATAVEYLHQQRIRHKDIKPQNILVKGGRVLLTDFGTSRSWADDSRGTTIGTNRQAFTKAYCAPEVAMHETRNTSADIWSLGCVFLEMCTVLGGKRVPEMRTFFANHGTGGTYVRDNPEGTDLWVNQLKELSPDNDDHQVLDLVQDMCDHAHENRPTATELVSLILDFEGQMYYDFCCDRDQEQDHIGGGDPDMTTMFYSSPPISEVSEQVLTTIAETESSSSLGKVEALSPKVSQASASTDILCMTNPDSSRNQALPSGYGEVPEEVEKDHPVDLQSGSEVTQRAREGQADASGSNAPLQHINNESRLKNDRHRATQNHDATSADTLSDQYDTPAEMIRETHLREERIAEQQQSRTQKGPQVEELPHGQRGQLPGLESRTIQHPDMAEPETKATPGDTGDDMTARPVLQRVHGDDTTEDFGESPSSHGSYASRVRLSEEQGTRQSELVEESVKRTSYERARPPAWRLPAEYAEHGGVEQLHPVSGREASTAPGQTDALVEQLTAMGFSGPESLNALKTADFDADKAVEYLVIHPDQQNGEMALPNAWRHSGNNEVEPGSDGSQAPNRGESEPLPAGDPVNDPVLRNRKESAFSNKGTATGVATSSSESADSFIQAQPQVRARSVPTPGESDHSGVTYGREQQSAHRPTRTANAGFSKPPPPPPKTRSMFGRMKHRLSSNLQREINSTNKTLPANFEGHQSSAHDGQSTKGNTKLGQHSVAHIEVKHVGGRSCKIHFKLSDTTQMLKNEIEALEDIPHHSQKLLFDGKELENDSTLESCRIKDGAIVYLVTGRRHTVQPDSDGMMPILVTWRIGELRSEVISIDVLRSHTIRAVKDKIRGYNRIPPAQQALFLADQPLIDDDRTLESYNIQYNDVVRMIVW